MIQCETYVKLIRKKKNVLPCQGGLYEQNTKKACYRSQTGFYDTT